MKTKYKYIHSGEEFTHSNQKYIKTNFDRGYYFEKGRKIFRHFNKSTVIETELPVWDC